MPDDEEPTLDEELADLFERIEQIGDRSFGDRPWRPRYFDRDGQPVSLLRWSQILNDDAYRHIASDYLTGGDVWVSTVLLGLDHNFTGHGPPEIFETMVFNHMSEEEVAKRKREWDHLGLPGMDFPWDEDSCFRYATEQEARDGHQEVVNALRVKDEEFQHMIEEARKHQ